MKRTHPSKLDESREDVYKRLDQDKIREGGFHKNTGNEILETGGRMAAHVRGKNLSYGSTGTMKKYKLPYADIFDF